jgi:RNA polymerase sigma-70 factor (ECF subfamily)
MRPPSKRIAGGSAAVDLDAELARARAGSRSALGRLLARVEPRLRMRAASEDRRGLGAGVSRSDLVQHVLLIASARFRRCRASRFGEFVCWVEAVYDKLVPQLRRNARRLKRGLGREVQGNRSTARSIEPADPGAEPPSAQARRNEAREGVNTAIDLLPDRYREVVLLHYRDRLTYKQIAVRLGIPAKSVEHYLSTAREKLRPVLRPFDDRSTADDERT